MQRPNPQDLNRILRIIRNADPEAYDKLVDWMQQDVGAVTVAVTDADPSSILVLQGRAQYARQVSLWLAEARSP